MPDKLAKELQQFERMTRAVLTVGDAVKDGLLKKQTLDALDKGIEAKDAKSKTLDASIIEAKGLLAEIETAASGVMAKAEKQAIEIVETAKLTHDTLIADATKEAAAASRALSVVKEQISGLEKTREDLKVAIANEEKKVGAAKDTLLKSLGGK